MVHVLAIALVTNIKRSVVEVEQHGNAGRSDIGRWPFDSNSIVTFETELIE